jgi:DNA-binding NarL/FixJ family response regulator
MTGCIKVLLVDDHQMFRSGLRALLVREAEMEVVGEASDGRAAVELVATLQPDVVVMDVRMPDLNGIEAARQAMGAKADLKIIALSAEGNERAMAEMLRAGAVGYVVKEAAYEELVLAIRTVVKGMIYFGPAVISRVVSDLQDASQSAGASAFGVLSSREREILQLIAEGKATKEIALALNISIKTAETHRRNVMDKLKIDNVAELTKYAIREGLTGI